LDESAAKFIVNSSFDSVYGARPLKRFLEKNIVTSLSKMIIAGSLMENSTVSITSNGSELKYDVEATSEPVTKKQKK